MRREFGSSAAAGEIAPIKMVRLLPPILSRSSIVSLELRHGMTTFFMGLGWLGGWDWAGFAVAATADVGFVALSPPSSVVAFPCLLWTRSRA